MPCYNAGKYLEQAIESIISQTYADFEFIIVNDGSSDDSADIIEKWEDRDKRIRVVTNAQNMGIAYVRNQGLELCRGEYIALMDADDIAPPYRLEEEKKYLDRNREIDAVSGGYIIIDEEGNERGTSTLNKLEPLETKAQLLFQNVIANGSVMYRKSVLKGENFHYQEDYFALEDYRFWCDFVKTKKIKVLPVVLQYYRIVSTGLSRKTATYKLELVNQLFDKTHIHYLRQCGIMLDKASERVYLEITRESVRTQNFFHWITIGKMLIKMYLGASNIDFKPELRKIMVKYWWAHRCL